MPFSALTATFHLIYVCVSWHTLSQPCHCCFLFVQCGHEYFLRLHCPDVLHLKLTAYRQYAASFSLCKSPSLFYVPYYWMVMFHRRRRFWCATHDCVAPYVDVILRRGRFWAKSAASGSLRWWCFRSCWMVLSNVMRGRSSCLLQSAGGEANRILLASALSSMRIICPNKVSRCDLIIAVSLGLLR